MEVLLWFFITFYPSSPPRVESIGPFTDQAQCEMIRKWLDMEAGTRRIRMQTSPCYSTKSS